jgi:hypothetical protein
MLSVIVVFAIAVPLMIWALSPSPVRKRSVAQGHHPTADLTSLPPATGAGGLDVGSSCDAGGGGCDGG